MSNLPPATSDLLRATGYRLRTTGDLQQAKSDLQQATCRLQLQKTFIPSPVFWQVIKSRSFPSFENKVNRDRILLKYCYN
jgi:hypothetical protein